ncbi:MAG TPA: serine/threonine-protein kinase [Polyangiaceae bacterium]|nr:serine/threonine-protein kinase [Polyangiaceae bacterium]
MTGSAPRALPRLLLDTVAAESAEVPSEATLEKGRMAPLPEASPYLAGEVVADRYRLVRELGRGGMGVVWVAHSLVLGVDVALKLIRASAAAPGVASRMAREAHAAARLGHPALVRVFDFGWTNRSDPFLVMELVQGETLSVLLGREVRVPAIRAVQMLLPIADGLRLAHERSIVHRDIKPDNIFMASDALGRQQPKLLDFGIAKVDHAVDGKITQFGAVLGSPEYMSPEQALGLDDIDQRTDVWSFCIVLYELITGSIPFSRPNYNALMHAIINEAPIPSHDCGAGDAALWLVIERGLAKEREQRWANMTELGEALALWLYEHGIKEDLSGNSIRAVWLDAALSGVRMDVPPSAPPGPRELTERAERRSSQAGTPDKHAYSRRALLAQPSNKAGRVAPAGPQATTVAALGLGAAIFGALTTIAAMRWSAAPQPAPTSSTRSLTPSASSPKVAPVAAPSVPSPPSASAAPLPLGSAAERPAVQSKGVNGSKRAALKRSHDFGF